MKGDDKDRGVRVFSNSENQCVWMKAGVVNFKLCQNAFDCTSCAFDKAMSRGLAKKPTALVSWREVMRNQPYLQKECRHMLTGRVQFKLCAHNYECKDCGYDQYLYDEDLLHRDSAVQVRRVAGFLLPMVITTTKGTVGRVSSMEDSYAWASMISHGGCSGGLLISPFRKSALS
ncbi:MAG: hypothetical protein WAN54_10040 [Syntrophobacteraceae bacterium]